MAEEITLTFAYMESASQPSASPAAPKTNGKERPVTSPPLAAAFNA